MTDGNKLRVVVDTNLLISAAISSNSLADKFIAAWQKDTFSLIISHEQLEEIRDVSKRKKFASYPKFLERIEELIQTLAFTAEKAEVLLEKDLPLHSRDPEDNFLLSAALGGSADYLITADEDLLVLQDHPALGKLKIMTVRDFLERSKI